MDEWTQLRKASVQLSTYNRCVLSHWITILLVNSHVNTNIIIIRSAFERAVERAKLENFQVQDCRHTFANKLVMAGVSLQAASAPRVGEFSTISARSVFAAVESGGDC